MAMKTRDQIYQEEAASLLRRLTTYHALTYPQVLRTFPKQEHTMQRLIKNLIKQGRIFYNADLNLLCDTEDAAKEPDYGIIAAYWVLLDFKPAILYDTSGEFPIKITFFSADEEFEIIYAEPGKEILLNHILAKPVKGSISRLVIISTWDQAQELKIPCVTAFCIVNEDGSVSYYRKRK
ncbi:MAG: DUF5697 family protein [Hespellia sp.]|nr:DUF5697 family protein [Hespellia sp.]